MKNITRHQVGDIRPSQLLLTYGVGAIVDLPHLSALILGLESWNTNQAQEIIEERLLAAVQTALGKQVKHLYSPPADESVDSPASRSECRSLPFRAGWSVRPAACWLPSTQDFSNCVLNPFARIVPATFITIARKARVFRLCLRAL